MRLGKPSIHGGVARRERSAEPCALALARGRHSLPNRRRRLRSIVVGDQLERAAGPQRTDEVDPIEQRAAQPAVVAEAVGVVAGALAADPSTRAAVARGDEHELCREAEGPLPPHDLYEAVFERLTESLERVARELGEL